MQPAETRSTHRVVNDEPGRRLRAPELPKEQRTSSKFFGLAEDGDAQRHEEQVHAGDEK